MFTIFLLKFMILSYIMSDVEKYRNMKWEIVKEVIIKMKRLGIDIGSTTVKVAVIDEEHNILFSEYKRHFANIKETLKELVEHASKELGNVEVAPTITGSGGLALAQVIGIPFEQEVVCVSEALTDYAPQTDVAIELGGEDAKIIYFEAEMSSSV